MATATEPRPDQAPLFGGFRKRAYTLPKLVEQARPLVSRRRDVAAIWRGRVDPGLREQIMVAVAQVNGCRYCCYVHTQWAQLEGTTDEDLARLEGLDPETFDRDEWLAISYATALAEGDFADSKSEVAAEIERRSGPQRREDIETIARAMTLANRMANTLDAFLSRLKGRPDAEGRAFDEALIASVLLVTGPFTVVVLAARLRMSPIRFTREILRLRRDQPPAN